MPFLSHPFRVLSATLKGLALVHIVFAYGWHVSPGAGPSMLPTFLVSGENFVVRKHGHRRGRNLRVGDCVAYAIPVEKGGNMGVKRVLGLPGDYVMLNSPPGSGEVVVDQDQSQGIAVTAGGGGGGGSEWMRQSQRKMMQVPPGHCYLIGDNLPWSRDSRDFGPIPLALVKGKVTHSVVLESWWPGSWFRPLDNGLVQPALRPE